MLSEQNYNVMKELYGSMGSWCIWEPAGDTPKSNTSDMSWVNRPDLLQTINTGFVFVGLNWSSTHGDQTENGTRVWAGFHSNYAFQNDYKLRYALTGTRYWGSYITDLIKFYWEVDSSKVRTYLNENPDFVKKNVRDFEEEISYLGDKPVLVALGGAVYKYLTDNLGTKYKIVPVKHYSYTISKENYREEVLRALDNV